MKEFDAIIGYAEIKRELEQTADILRNIEAYKAAGAKLPSGLLIHGEPGLGKSLMAECLIAASGLPSFTVRKDKSNGDFVDFLKATFDQAAEAAPSIVYLDDMDKFANTDGGHKNAEEYVAVQSCIDAVKGKDVFVLATTNSFGCLPDSLLRAGRFDRKIFVYTPTGDDADGIIRRFLTGKPLANDIIWKDVVMLMSNCSCAQLESTLNEALIISISKKESLISRDSFMEAYFKTRVMPTSGGGFSNGVTASERRQFAIHEAGHAAVYEIVLGGVIALMTIFKGSANDGGICHYCRPADCSNEDWSEVQVLGGLGGRAASELFFGVPDRGSSKDLMQVTRILNGDIESGAIPGSPLAKMLPGRGSEDYKHRIERVAETEMAKRYQLVKEILTANREFVEKLADAIAISEYLVASDIQEIREACGIVKLPHWHRQLIG